MKESEGLAKADVSCKTIWQTILWLAEIIGVPSLFVFLYSLLRPFSADAVFINYVERYLQFYAIYQIAVFCILNSKNDSRRDALLAVLTLYKYTELFQEQGDQFLKEKIEVLCAKQLDTGVLNHIDIRNEYVKIKSIISIRSNENLFLVKERIIYYEHFYEASALAWKYSFLVKLFK